MFRSVQKYIQKPVISYTFLKLVTLHKIKHIMNVCFNYTNAGSLPTSRTNKLQSKSNIEVCTYVDVSHSTSKYSVAVLFNRNRPKNVQVNDVKRCETGLNYTSFYIIIMNFWDFHPY